MHVVLHLCRSDGEHLINQVGTPNSFGSYKKNRINPVVLPYKYGVPNI